MLPKIPDVPADHRGTGHYRLRFEDVTQDGRIQMEAIVASVGAGVWVPVLAKHPLALAIFGSGIRPIFTRLVIEATEAALELDAPLTAHGLYELAHERAADGTVERLYLNMWTEIHGKPRKGSDASVLAGRLFAEHVLARIHGLPAERKVTEIPGFALPAAQYQRPRPEEMTSLPSGATWLEPEARPDPGEVLFGVLHTDTNQHVNSLVYPRLFEEAALRRFKALGRDAKVLGRSLEISFRKPFFAGDAARISLRAFARGDRLGAAGVFEAEKAHTYVRMGFDGA